MYEAEAQALKKGIIKAYSGKDSRRARGEAQLDNSDLQHFLNAGSDKDHSSMKGVSRTSSMPKRNSLQSKPQQTRVSDSNDAGRMS